MPSSTLRPLPYIYIYIYIRDSDPLKKKLNLNMTTVMSVETMEKLHTLSGLLPKLKVMQYVAIHLIYYNKSTMKR
jgi:hypothetical protein